MNFNTANDFSKCKDKLLKDYWEFISYDGRYLIVNNKFLQKLKMDIVIQGHDDNTEYSIDTKHTRGDFPTFALEELSNSNPDFEKLGWILEKKDYYPDFVLYFFWKECQGCRDNCTICYRTLNYKMYVFIFNKLRPWFINYIKEQYDAGFIPNKTREFNHTTWWPTPIKTCLRTDFCFYIGSGQYKAGESIFTGQKSLLDYLDMGLSFPDKSPVEFLFKEKFNI